MKIGSDVLLGWKVNIRKSDGHIVYDNITKIKNPIQKKYNYRKSCLDCIICRYIKGY